MNLSFLLGSGISMPLLPGVSEITDRILSDDFVQAFTDGSFRLSSPHDVVGLLHNARQAEIDEIRMLMRAIRQHVADLGGARGENSITYEEISDIIEFYIDNYSGIEALRHPIVEPFFDNLILKLPIDSRLRSVVSRDGWAVPYAKHLFYTCRRFIGSMVRQLLTDQESFLEAHCTGAIVELLRTCEARIDLVTLNHDTILEAGLSSRGVSWCDGFGDQVYGVREWLPQTYEVKAVGLRLFKLHGSVDWSRISVRDQNGRPLSASRVAIPVEPFVNGRRPLPDGNTLQIEDDLMCLRGSVFKRLAYSDSIYLEMIQRVRAGFLHSNQLCVIGYGFRDRGVNLLLQEWISQTRQGCTLIVIDKNLPQLESRDALRWLRVQIDQVGGRFLGFAKDAADVSARDLLGKSNS